MPDRVREGRRDWLTAAILLAAFVSLAAGLLLPAISMTTLWYTEEYSLLGAVEAFAAEGRWFLFMIVGTFTIVTPALKIFLSAWLWCRSSGRRRLDQAWINLIRTISRWSMLDVFVLALTVLLIDGRLLTTADVGSGVVFFAAAVVLSAWAAHRLGSEPNSL